MSTEEVPENQTISARLVSERERLGMTQAVAMALAECSRSAWIEKEAGRSELKASELARLDEHGFDVYFILTGEHAAGALADVETTLIEAFRRMRPAEQSMLLGAVLGWAHPTRILPWLAGGTGQEFAVEDSAPASGTTIAPGSERRRGSRNTRETG